jgi:hypothetical protein
LEQAGPERRPLLTEDSFVINQSHLKSWNNCNRLYGWLRIERLEPALRRSAPEIGTAVHAGLRILHSEGGTLEAAREATKVTLSERAGPKIAFEDKSLPQAEAVADAVLTGYSRYWTEKDQMWAPIDQEIQFMVEIEPGWWKAALSGTLTPQELLAWKNPTGIFLRGRADNLSMMHGGLYLIDYKTAGKMDPRDLLKYELDMQLSAYIYGLSKQLTLDSAREGKEPILVRGALIDLLVKTNVPQYARELYTRSVEEMSEFESEFVEYGKRIRESHARVRAGEEWKRVFPKNTEHCFRYGTCAFRDLCLKDTPIRRAAFDARKADYVDLAQEELDKKTSA